MEIVMSVCLLMGGAVAAVWGVNYYLQEKNKESIRNSILIMGLAVACWACGYGAIGLCDNFAVASFFRKIGMLGVDLFLVTETFLYINKANRPMRRRRLIKAICFGCMAADWYFFTRDHVDTFVKVGRWTTWYGNRCPARTWHFIFLAFLAVVMASYATIWYSKMKYRRERFFLRNLYMANILMLVSILPDTILSAMGHTAIPTSALGAGLTYVFIYLAAERYNGFAISTKNLNSYINDSVNVGMLFLNMDHQVEIANAYARKSLKIEEEGVGLSDLFRLDTDEAALLSRAEQWDHLSHRCVTADGRSRCVLNITLVRDSYGEPLCYAIAVYDVTREEELIQKAEAANQAKSSFLAGISHEIRTPINVVLGMDEMILRESSDPTILSYAENIRRAGQSLLVQINDILDMTKVEAGKMEIVPVDYSLKELIADYRGMGQVQAEKKDLLLYMEAAEDLPSKLHGDEVRIKQIITNIFTNALKYTERGSVTINFSGQTSKEGQFELIVSVRDTGIGIRKEDLPRLFDSFERVNLIKNRSIEGSGLGLSIVRGLLELMGGQITVESTYGEGSCFTVTIPQEVVDATAIGPWNADADREAGAVQHRAEGLRAEGKSILVVDDIPMNIMVVQAFLKNSGIRIDTAESGKEALKRIAQRVYDLIFLDHMMPEMDGVATLAKMREDATHPNQTTPVIVMTANAFESAREQYLEAGFDDYIAKPIVPEKLEDMIRKYVPLEESPAGGIAEETQHMPEETQQEPLLERISFLNIPLAMEYCMNDVDFLKEMLGAYVGDPRADEIEEAFCSENWAEYERLVHALKSTSRSIGADVVADAAYRLEQAQKDNDILFIRENHNLFMELYRELLEKITKEI